MATQIVEHNKPAYQLRKDGDPDENIDLVLKHPFVPYVVHSVTYHRTTGAAVPTNLQIIKRRVGTADVILKTILTPAVDVYEVLEEELQHEESLWVKTAGAVLAGVETHEASINWSERTELP